jgi:hypothetical protein
MSEWQNPDSRKAGTCWINLSRVKTPLLLTSLKKLAQGLLYESTRFIKPLHNINHPSRMITTRLPIRIISMIPPSEP